MSDITTVRLEDVHRRPNARPIDEELVRELTASMELIGFSPAKPVVVRPDGEIYWIIDGAHRVAAAQAAGIEDIPAEVEDIDEAGVLTREGALNLQRPDTLTEKWARAQEFFLLGDVTSEAIEVATGIPADQQPKVRRVLVKLNDETVAEDLSLEQSLAAHEFIDDDAAFKAIMDAGMGWRAIHSECVRDRERAEGVAEAKAIIESAGCELITDVNHAEYQFLGRGDEVPEGARFARIVTQTWSASVDITWYGDITEEAHDPEVAARQEAEANRTAELAQAAERRLAFVAEHLSSRGYALSSELIDYAVAEWEDGTVAQSGRIHESLAEVQGFVPRVYAALLSEIEVSAATGLRHQGDDWYYLQHNGEGTVGYLDALVQVGFVLTEVEKAELDIIKAALEPQAEVEGGDDDE